MLSITRDLRKNSIMIGDDIKIQVVAVSGGQVKLAIEAPKETKILRSELLESNEETA